MILNVCYVFVGLFCTVCNGIYSKMFIFVVSCKNYEKNVGPNHSQYIPLRAELPFPSSCCKGEVCLPRSHYKEEASSPKFCIEG